MFLLTKNKVDYLSSSALPNQESFSVSATSGVISRSGAATMLVFSLMQNQNCLISSGNLIKSLKRIRYLNKNPRGLSLKQLPQFFLIQNNCKDMNPQKQPEVNKLTSILYGHTTCDKCDFHIINRKYNGKVVSFSTSKRRREGFICYHCALRLNRITIDELETYTKKNRPIVSVIFYL